MNVTCCICLCEVTGEECTIYNPKNGVPENVNMPVKLRECGHVFHWTCIDKGIRYNGKCPLCRNDAYASELGFLTFRNEEENNYGQTVPVAIIGDTEIYDVNELPLTYRLELDALLGRREENLPPIRIRSLSRDAVARFLESHLNSRPRNSN